MDNTLNKFGYGFQVKVLTNIITDRDFTSQCLDLIDINYFDNKSLQFLVEHAFEYFREYRVLPTLEVFKVQISNLDVSQFKTEVISTLKDAWSYIGSHDLEFIRQETLKFCRHQEIRKAFERGIDLIKVGQYDELVTEISNANKKGQVVHDFGLDYLLDVDYRYSEEGELDRVATGFDVLDSITSGGLPKKKMGIVMAPTGIGKTWLLAYLGANALKQGKTVIHYTLELDDIYTAQRYDSILSGIPFDDLKYNVQNIKKTLSKFNGKLFIKEFPPNTLTINQMESHIDKYILSDIQPDLIILDYAELLYIDYDKNMREDKVLGQLYTNLRGLAGRKNFALWTADQTNRGGTTKNVVEGNDISNAFAKLFAMDFLMTLQRRPKDKMTKTARIHISKSRLGPDGFTFPCAFDTDRGFIEIYDEDSDTGKKIKNSMITDDEYNRHLLKDRYEEFTSKKDKTNIF